MYDIGSLRKYFSVINRRILFIKDRVCDSVARGKMRSSEFVAAVRIPTVCPTLLIIIEQHNAARTVPTASAIVNHTAICLNADRSTAIA